jgi:hypothetical protein
MAAVTSETRNYNAIQSTTLENWAKGIGNEITTSMFFYYALKKSGSYVTVADPGERARYALRYQNGTADSFSGYDVLNTTPMDGITSAFFDWAQMSVSISISRKEERQNSGEAKMLDLLEEKTNQAMDGIKELFMKAIMQGNGPNTATAITTQYTSPMNGSLFVTPLPLLVGQTASSGTIGGVSAANSWWQNQKIASSDGSFAAVLKDLDHLRNLCSKGVGGAPDMHLVDQSTQELYVAALRSQNRFTDTMRADIPFDNVAFHRQPVVWDEFMPNWSGATTVQSTTQGTWLMLNSQFMQMKYDAQTDFITTPFIRPENQDAKTAQILWMGTLGTNNRRKHGVDSDIDTTITS